MSSSFSRLLFLSLCCSLLFFSSKSQDDDQKTYIVYMGSHSKNKVPTSSHHMRMLKEAIGSTFAPRSLLHSYKRSFNGFVVKLTEVEAHKVSKIKGVISIFPNEKKQLHTTRSWDFMGFYENVDRVPSVESDIIVGILDTGIWPESPSFDDSGYGPPPAKWKGSCEVSANFSCNNKIVGARSYRSHGRRPTKDIEGPRDSDGHGTHTASTVVGGLVRQASMFGLGLGTARGGVPSSRIAVYKVCWLDGCYDADILAAFDDAIADGVDILSVSLGGRVVKNYFNDSIAIGAFHAMKSGILTSMSAGNQGPGFSSIKNFSPWSMSVAASTTDRKFVTGVELGDGRGFNGTSVNTFDLNGTQFPLVYAGDIPAVGFSGSESRFCKKKSVEKELVKGKIVVCDVHLSPRGVEAIRGAAGIIMQTDFALDLTFSYPLPASHLASKDGAIISSYITSQNRCVLFGKQVRSFCEWTGSCSSCACDLVALYSTATILKSIEGKHMKTPFVATFSSRGPNPITPNILKPDLSGPGVEILAAWSPIASPSGDTNDNKRVFYNIISGTSMSCPHATAAAAYVKSFHPTWSPSALKSALMTTAIAMNLEINPNGEFSYGSGHINPLGAVNPGLIYDASEIDYVKFLCGQGYTTELLQQVSGDDNICSPDNSDAVFDLNYPSFALSTLISKPISQIYRRSVTNVGSESSTYEATILDLPKDLNITINPKILSFKALGEQQSFEVRIEGKLSSNFVSASLMLDDGVHKVISPIIVFDANVFTN